MENFSIRESPSYAGYRVLVADDNAINCQIAKRMLEKLECEVDLASSGKEVLSHYERQRYDLILLDCQMPDMDGYQVCQTLRQIEKSDRHTPIIGWTAHAHPEEIEKCLAAGMDDCLSKRLHMDGWSRMLDTWLIRRTILLADPHPADLSGLEVMHRISGAGFAELVKMFEEDMPQRLLDLRSALQASDHLLASRIAHMMSGCCASIGAMHLSDLCHDVERQMKSCSQQDMQDKLTDIASAYEQIRLTLHAMLRRPASSR